VPKPDDVRSKGETAFASGALKLKMKGLDKGVLTLGKSTTAEMLIELPSVQKLGFRLVDRILVPAGRIGESLALMNNTMVKIVEHFKSLAATTLGGLRLQVTVGKPSKFYAPTVRIVGSRKAYEDDCSEEFEVATVSKDGVGVMEGYTAAYGGLSPDFRARFEQVGKWMLLLHECLTAKGDMQVVARKQFGTTIPTVMVVKKPYAVKAPPVELDIDMGYDMAKGEYITRHSSIKELYLKREKAVDIAVEIRKMVSQELTAWKETWFDAKLELFALEEKEKQAAEKKEVAEYAKMYDGVKKEIAAHEKKTKAKLFPGRLVGDDEGEQFKRLADFAAKHGHGESLSEFISADLYKRGLVKWRQGRYKKLMRGFKAGAMAKADVEVKREIGAAKKERREFFEPSQIRFWQDVILRQHAALNAEVTNMMQVRRREDVLESIFNFQKQQ
jgi:hypothetical protein